MTRKALLGALSVSVAASLTAGCGWMMGWGEPPPAEPIDATTLDIEYVVRPSVPLPIETCEQIDIVFAVDDSGSMQEEMSELRNNIFPAFAEALRAGVDGFRVGVIDACPEPASFHTRGDGGPCNFESGQLWMDSSSTNLEAEFACVGNIYSEDTNCSGDNDDEQPVSSMAAALENPAWSGQMLRDEALLVLVAVTDEDERPTPVQEAPAIYDRLIALKGDDVRRIVFLGIGGRQKCDGEYGWAMEAIRLKGITDIFGLAGRGFFWDLCDGGLEDGLLEALATIEEACGEFPNSAPRDPREIGWR